jgi:hypothetical protein
VGGRPSARGGLSGRLQAKFLSSAKGRGARLQTMRNFLIAARSRLRFARCSLEARPALRFPENESPAGPPRRGLREYAMWVWHLTVV